MFICIRIPKYAKHWRLSLVQVRNVYFTAHPVGSNWTLLVQAQKSTNSLRDKSQLTAFFQNHQKSQPIAFGHDVIHTPVHFLSGVFIMTFVIVTSSARERELYSMCAPERALSQIVLSLTKPNDKI